MTPALEEAIERLRQMPPDRQDAFARLLLREMVADEQWMRSIAQYAEWLQQRTKWFIIAFAFAFVFLQSIEYLRWSTRCDNP